MKPTERVSYFVQHDKSKKLIHKNTKKKVLHNLVVKPEELFFKSFELNRIYKKSIQVTNRGRNTTRFEVLQLPRGSEFSFQLVSAKTSLAPGITGTILISFNPTKHNDKYEMLCIKLDNGEILYVALNALTDPPNLTFFGKELEFYSPATFDLGCFFVGSHNKVDVCAVHHGSAARYFILSLARYGELEAEFSIPTQMVQINSFTIEPVYFNMKNESKLNFSFGFSPQYVGLNSDKVIFLCDNGMSNAVTFKGCGVTFVKSDIVFEDVETKSNLLVNSDYQDDPTCEWFCDMGAVCNSLAVRTFTLRNNCPAKNKFEFEWRVEPICGKERVSIPVENVSIAPSNGEFTHQGSVSFQVSCNVPSELYADAGFITRLFCYLPKGSVYNKEMSSSELDDSEKDFFISEENYDFDIRSNDPSIIIPSDPYRDCICVGSIEFLLNCCTDVRISFNPCYINFQAPLTVNEKTKHYVLVRNECAKTLTCECSWQTEKTIQMNMTLKYFKLCPFAEKCIDIVIKPISLEPFELEIIFHIEENQQYQPKLKVTGTVSAGEIDVVEDIVNCGTVKHFNSIQIPIEFKNHINTKTQWNMYKIKESFHDIDTCFLEHFLLRSMGNADCTSNCGKNNSFNETETVKDFTTENMKNKIENELVCDNSLVRQKNIQGLINDFQKMFPEMCRINEQKSKLTLNSQIENFNEKNAQYLDEIESSYENLNFIPVNLKCSPSENDSKTIIDLNYENNNNENIEPILIGCLSSSYITQRPGMLSFESKFPGLEYKLLELRAHDCVRHKLLIAEFCPPLVALRPTVIDIENTSLNVQSKARVNLVNLTTCSWEYSWGQPEGMVNFTMDKEHGTLEPEQTEEVVITFQPTTSMCEETCIPCFIEGFKEPLRLVIQCKVEELLVIISWNTRMQKMTFFWPNEELYIDKLIWCGLEVFQMCPKPLLKVDSSSISYERDSSVLENFTYSKSDSVVSILDFNFTNYTEKGTKTSSFTEKNIVGAEEENLLRKSSVTIPPFESLLYNQYEGIYCDSLHFENVNHKIPTKQTITVSNPTTQPCKFRIRVQYFTPRITEKQAKKYVIPTKRMHDVNWEDLVGVNKGLVITVSNAEHEIANEDLDVEVWVYANTWGLYMDTITLEFSNLPSFYIPVSVSVKSPPVQFLPSKCFQNIQQYIHEMSPISFGSTVNSNIIPLENTSGVPLKVFWTTSDEGEEYVQKEWTDIAINMISFKDLYERLSKPEQSSTAFYINENARLMKLEANNNKRMLTIHFNTDVLSHEMDPSLFIGRVTGYIGVDAGLVENIGVYREVKQISCQVHAMAGASRLQFMPYEPEELLFCFEIGRIYSSPTKINKEKTFELQNIDNFSAICEICMEEPFSVIQVDVAENSIDFNRPVLVPPKQTVYITVCCTLTADTLKETEIFKTVNHKLILCEKGLQVLYNMNLSVTTLQLGVQIIPPVIKLSEDLIDFPTIYLGDTAFKSFQIEIINGEKDDIQILPPLNKQSPFSFQVDHSTNKTLKICIKFTPKETKYFEEEWKITAYNTSKKLHISGSADEDQKYKV